MNTPPKVFLDTSVIFAAVLSPEGGARMVLRLGESRLVHLWIGRQVLKECEAVILRKAADSLPNMALLLDTA
ncbi:PIN domain-containing protein, partial [Anaerolinea sp.]